MHEATDGMSFEENYFDFPFARKEKRRDEKRREDYFQWLQKDFHSRPTNQTTENTD